MLYDSYISFSPIEASPLPWPNPALSIFGFEDSNLINLIVTDMVIFNQ